MSVGEQKNNRVFIIGPMGAGKTTIGKILASNLKMEFFDTDLEIERRTGATVSWIFDVEGESGFRDREEDLVEELTKRSSLVLATGGGVVIREKNRQTLSNRGFVVYLRADFEELLERMRGDKKRPLLQVENPELKLQELLSVREPLYLTTANLVVDTRGRCSKLIAKKLTDKLKEIL